MLLLLEGPHHLLLRVHDLALLDVGYHARDGLLGDSSVVRVEVELVILGSESFSLRNKALLKLLLSKRVRRH